MNNKHFTLTGLWTVVLWGLTACADEGHVYDICEDHLLEFKNVGDKGTVVFNGDSLKGLATNPCIVKISTCSSCRIRVTSSTPTKFFCNSAWESMNECRLGCDYLYIFDTYYLNETLLYYRSWGAEGMERISESGNIFIGICHGNSKSYNISVNFEIQGKILQVDGSPSYKSFGPIMSPFFPKGYSQNSETFEYSLTNDLSTGYVRLVFDDWHMAPSSDFYFVDSNIVGLVSGDTRRPMVLSNKNTLTVKFRTGSSLEPTSRKYMGFRATYTFLKERVPLARTNCKEAGYLFNSYGGYIEFRPSSKQRLIYDCLWVLKKQVGYSGVTMRIVKYTNPGYRFRGENSVHIKSGTTSSGYTVTVIDQLDNIDNGIPYKDTEGFYIRLNGSYDSSDIFAFAYASYKPYHACSPSMFQCDSGLCIHSSLKCDGHDNCGDNSDETKACGDYSGPYDKSYQYTITIGVIIPMVISVFLIMVICLLFVMIRRCRRARMQEAGSSERLRTLSEEVSRSRGRRRRRHRRHMFGERDLPPTYDEAMQNPPGWYLNVAFANPVDPSLPQPPSYTEAVTQEGRRGVARSRPRSHSPTSTDSSHSELTVGSHNRTLSSSSSDEGDNWGDYAVRTDGRRGRRSRHMSSSDSDNNTTECQSLTDNQSTASRSDGRRHVENEHAPRASPSSERSVDGRSEHEEDKILNENKIEPEKHGDVDSKYDPKKSETPTEFVIPDSAKVENEQQDTRSYASRLVQSVLGTKSSFNSNTGIELRGRHSRNRSMSSESEAVPEEGRRKGKKKAKKPKGKKGKGNRDRVMECLDDTSHPTVPCNSEGASNFDTEHVPTQRDYADVNVNGEVLDEDYYSQDRDDVSGGGSVPRDSVDYEMVVNVDNEEVMLVYDTNFCEIPQNQDQYSQSRSVPRRPRHHSTGAMETDPSSSCHGSASQSQSDISDIYRSDRETSLEPSENCDRNHGNRPEADLGEGEESGPVSPSSVRYISFKDDLGDDIYV